MFESFGRSWNLIKQSWNVLQANRSLLVFPLVSFIATIVITILFAIPMAIIGLSDGGATTTGDDGISIPMLIVLFLFYLVTYTAVIFSNSALIGAAMMYMRGEQPTVADGFRIASERFGKIFGYAAIAATVGLILNLLRNNDSDNMVMRIIGVILSGVLSVAWNLITFLVIPVLVMENLGPIEAIKRSGSLLRQTWGEQIAGSFSIGGIFFLISLGIALVLGVPLFALASAANTAALWILAVAVIILVFVGVSLVGGAVNGIFQAALYRYATEGTAGEFFSEDVVRGAFRPKNA